MLLCGCSTVTNQVTQLAGATSPQQSEGQAQLSGGEPPQMFEGESVLQIGDCLVVTVMTDDGMAQADMRQTVDRNGNIVVPDVGTVQVAGLRFEDVEPAIEQKLVASDVADRIRVLVSRCP
jgi:protein involved in polysaccharide export with SLBB domain